MERSEMSEEQLKEIERHNRLENLKAGITYREEEELW